jgi:hypothetical protein
MTHRSSVVAVEVPLSAVVSLYPVATSVLCDLLCVCRSLRLMRPYIISNRCRFVFFFQISQRRWQVKVPGELVKRSSLVVGARRWFTNNMDCYALSATTHHATVSVVG